MLGVVIGRTACRVAESRAHEHIAGYLIVNDVSVPHPNYYRPVGSLQGARWLLPAGPAGHGRAPAVGNPDALTIRTYVDGALVQTDEHRRSDPAGGAVAGRCHRIHDLAPGDVLALGAAAPAPRVRAGQTVAIEIDGLGRISNPFIAERSMMRARVAYAGAIHEATPASGDRASRVCASRTAACSRAEEVVWLPPFEARHGHRARPQLRGSRQGAGVQAQEEPLVFLKGPGTLLGHRGVTRRPAEVSFMHYECELAVVIGRTGEAGTRAPRPCEHVAGYCIANDYAIRDYLENWYRPNLRVKNRDGATVLGPWFVDAADIADPGNLGLRTYVNGKLTQQGNTRDLIFDIPVSDRIPELLHDLASGRRDSDRHAGGRAST